MVTLILTLNIQDKIYLCLQKRKDEEARAVPPAAAAALRSGRVKSALQIFPTARKVLPLQVSVPLQAAPQERTVLAAGESERLQRAAQQLPRQTAAALRVELQHGARPAQELPAAAGAVRISQTVQVPARSAGRCRGSYVPAHCPAHGWHEWPPAGPAAGLFPDTKPPPPAKRRTEGSARPAMLPASKHDNARSIPLSDA